MKDYIPNLKGRHIVMISDYIDDYDNEDLEKEKAFLVDVQKNIEKHEIKFFYEEVKNINDIETALSKFDKNEIIVFNWCEEIFGIPKGAYLVTDFLAVNNYIYTGANSACLQLTQDKIAVKEVLIKNNVSTPKSFVCKKNMPIEIRDCKFPLIVKTQSEHGSIGLTKDSIVSDLDALEKRVNYLFDNFSGDVLVEEYIDGGEYIVSIMGNKNPQVLPILEIDFSKFTDYHDRILSFDSKWTKDSVEYNNTPVKVPDNLSKDLEKAIKIEARKAYLATGCLNYGRMEIRERNGKPYIIDVNANPYLGHYPDSFFISNEMIGFNNGETLIRICEFALEEFV